jgi:hypothetical protein
MFEHVIYKTKSWISKIILLSLRQMRLGWEVVDALIPSRYFHQKKVSLPVGLSTREATQYIKHQQAKLMQLDSSEYCLRFIPIYHDKEKKVDGMWCMALKQSFSQQMRQYLHLQKKILSHMVCDWQYALDQIGSHHKAAIKKGYWVCCCIVQNMTVFIGCIRDKVIHIDMLQKIADVHWINQQVDIFISRSRKDVRIRYLCSSDILEILTLDDREKWSMISMEQPNDHAKL